MPELIRMVRAEGEVAHVRPDWVDEWRGWGWRIAGEVSEATADEGQAEASTPRRRGRPRTAA